MGGRHLDSEVGAGRAKAAALCDYLTALWPALPFMGFGFCAAWTALACGTAWLSPGESTGGALTNLLVVVSAATGVTLFLIGALRRRAMTISRPHRLRMTCGVAGLCALVGSVALLMIGPSYLQRALSGYSYEVFQASALLIGVSLSVLYLRLGVIYALLPLRRAILYLCYAQLLAIFVYLSVQVAPKWAPASNSPSLAFMVVFSLLPLFAAASLCLSPHKNPWVSQACGEKAPVLDGVSPRADGESRTARDAREGELGYGEKPLERAATHGRYIPLVCFSIALFLFAAAQSAVSAAVTNSVAPAYTLASADVVMLVRIPLLLLFALLASTIEATRLNFGRLLVALVILLEVMVVLGMLVGLASTAWLVPVHTVVFAFEMLTWCMIFAVANCHQSSSETAVCLAYGSYALGTGLGTLAGARLSATFGTTPLLAVCAVALLPCFLLLSDRNMDGLFTGAHYGTASLSGLLGKRLQPGTPHVKGDFMRRLEDYARANGLSAREAEALRYLVAGRGDSQIAEAMGISYNTARTHVRNIFNKLGVHDRQSLIDVVNDAVGR